MQTLQDVVAADLRSCDPRKRHLAERFWRYVDRSSSAGCWPWTGAKKRGGYGHLMVGTRGCRRPVLAIHVSLVLDGRMLPPGLVTRHLCNVPACVRPDHLVVGTQAENNADKVAAGRSTRGERNPARKLREEQALAIRQAHGSATELATLYGVSPSAIYHVRAERTWRHVGGLSQAVAQ